MLKDFYRNYGKRLLDLTIAVPVLLLGAPIAASIAAMVCMNMGSPVLFRQKRPGLSGQPFDVLKFRSMRELRDAAGKLLSDAERLTPLGAFLRQTSLDELPQFWNVVRGDMSLVGPRPLLMEYLTRYSPEQARRHELKPGIAGWAQVNGRNALTWEEKFACDVWYVDNCSLALDLKILWRAGTRVLRRDGISAAGHATMPEFLGTGWSVEHSAESP